MNVSDSIKHPAIGVSHVQYTVHKGLQWLCNTPVQVSPKRRNFSSWPSGVGA
jgi:hypothetical protein